MRVKDTFSENEWFLLSSMPGLVGAAMSNAAPSGIIGTIKEMSAAMRASVQAKDDYPDSELINALMTKAENWEEAKEKMADYKERFKQHVETENVKNRDQLQKLALRDCRAASELVDKRCSDSDAAIYKQWTVQVARRVAEAAKEGSVLGFGGERVSSAERKLLMQIEAALGVSSGQLFA